MNRQFIRYVDKNIADNIVGALNVRFVDFGSYLSRSQKPTFTTQPEAGEVAIFANFSKPPSKTTLNLIKTYADGVVTGMNQLQTN